MCVYSAPQYLRRNHSAVSSVVMMKNSMPYPISGVVVVSLYTTGRMLVSLRSVSAIFSMLSYVYAAPPVVEASRVIRLWLAARFSASVFISFTETRPGLLNVLDAIVAVAVYVYCPGARLSMRR